ncbi:hypothetical protein ACFL2M_01475 [Patescibacteria group bacterium]
MKYQKAIPTIKELRKISRPEKEPTAFYQAYSQYLSIYLTWLFVKFNIKANTVTALMSICSLLGMVCVMPEIFAIRVVGVVLFLLGALLDWSDGEVARYHRHAGSFKEKKYTPSIKGNYLDKIYHHFTALCLIIGMTLNSYLYYDSLYVIIGGLVITIFLLIKLLTKYISVSSIFTFFAISDHLKFFATDVEKFRNEVYLTPKKLLFRKIIGSPGGFKIRLLLIAILLGPLVQSLALVVYGAATIAGAIHGILRGAAKNVDTQFARFTIEERNKKEESVTQ